VGVAQANPVKPHLTRVWWLLLGFGAAAVALQLLFLALSQQRVVWHQTFAWQRGAPTTIVSEPFELTGRRSNVVVELDSTVTNEWAYFDLALVNDATGTALNFGREVSYYSGHDSDGFWSEGGRRDRVYLPSVAPGRYVLTADWETSARQLSWSVTVRRDVPRSLYVLGAIVLLALPPLFLAYRYFSFEHTRWRESDRPPIRRGRQPGERRRR